MLAAGATLSMIAPIGAQASDINIEGMNSYLRNNSSSKKQFNSKTFSKEITTLNKSVDNLENRMNVLEAGGFSDTTVMDGKAVFDIGAINYDLTDSAAEALQFAYSYTLNLNSSFTGDDNLYVRIKTGNHGGWMVSTDDGGYLSSVGKNDGALNIDKIWYQFSVGDNNTVWVGPKIENYYMHGTAPSIYKPITKQFALGGNGNAYGASTDTGAGWAYKADNGFAISSNIGTKSKTTNGETGLLTNESKTSWATQIGYTQPQYSASVIVNQKYNGWTDGYYHTAEADDALVTGGNHTAIGLRGWWRPEETGSIAPSISLGFDTTQYDGTNNLHPSDSSYAWFVGMMWQDMVSADDKIGLAFGKPTSHAHEGDEPFAYELYYSYQANDSVTITPTIFGGTNREAPNDDVFGALVQTTFKF